MKFCAKCGKQLEDDANFCVYCGSPTEARICNGFEGARELSSLKKTTRVFMIIGCVLSAFYYLVPLIWTIPMTIAYCNKLKNHEEIGVGFKVCSLIFVSTIAGILMLCDKEQ